MNFRLICLLMCVCLAFVLEPVTAQQSTKDQKLNKDSQGRNCRLEIKTKDKSEKLTYAARIVSVDNKTITITNVTKTLKKEQGVPLLEKVPYLTRLFKNVAVGRVKLKGDLKLRHSDIIEFEFLKESE